MQSDHARVVERLEPDDDAFRRIPAMPSRGMQARHWLGVVALTGAVGGAAFVVPPLISGSDPDQSAGAPLSSAPAAGVPSAVAPSGQLPAPGGGSAPASVPVAAGPTRPARAANPTSPAGQPAPPPPATGGTTPAAPTRGTPSRTPAPTTPAPATGFTPITVQAENATLSDGASVTGCDGCGSGQRVRWMGRIELPVTVPAAGERTITVVYTVEGSRRLSVEVNGTLVMSDRKVTGTSWQVPLRTSVTTRLPAGRSTIAVDGGPDIDAIRIS